MKITVLIKIIYNTLNVDFFFLKKGRTEAVSTMTPFPHSVQTNITWVRVGLHITQTNEHLQKFSGLSHWHQPDRGWKLWHQFLLISCSTTAQWTMTVKPFHFILFHITHTYFNVCVCVYSRKCQLWDQQCETTDRETSYKHTDRSSKDFTRKEEN